MSMMECAHCRRAAEARSMQSCGSCGGMVCSDCGQMQNDCPGDGLDYEQ